MQKDVENAEFALITPEADISDATHGGRAKCLQRLIRLGLPVPTTVALSFATVRGIAQGQMPDLASLMCAFGPDPLLSVRPSSEDPDWGGPGAILNIGMCDSHHAALTPDLGQAAADALYVRFIRTYAVHVARLDPEMFDFPGTPDRVMIDGLLSEYAEQMEEDFPQSAEAQLSGVLRSMARSWEGPTARLLRQAKGAPADAGLGLVVQKMALGVGRADIGECGSGLIQFVSSDTGEAQVTGRYLSQSQGRAALTDAAGALYLTRDKRGPSLEELCPDAFEALCEVGARCRSRLREEMQIEFTIAAGHLAVLDAIRVNRTARAAVRIAVDLAESGVISRGDALLRVTPESLSGLLHRQVDPEGVRDVISRGIGASPGAATGKIVFSARDALAAAARDEDCILVGRETTPDDVRGMHAAVGVLTEKGGATSHAAVIARGFGIPCVVGAGDLGIDRRKRRMRLPGGRLLQEGDTITLDGTTGAVMAGAAPLMEPALGRAFHTLLAWADAERDIGIRVNADTPAEAQMARDFAAEGIGLCRTEHMFFEPGRLSMMREAIITESAEDRAAALEQLLRMQRDDFAELFRIMKGLPVCIRLLDPPLHEFLPVTREGLHELAEALDVPLARIEERVRALSEVNPMLGMRGVRLGIVVPEIYEMQARAIFEAAAENGDIVPEVMIPLVSARREVELVRSRIDAVAGSVRGRTGVDLEYRLGIMVETPRAALRADEIAPTVSFLSFGTNDLTQMTYGLSRDDAGRFMSTYVSLEVFPEDPFLRLDTEGVGELLRIGAERGRAAKPDIVLSVCGEHGGDPDSIAFCRAAGFDYVSCSAFRVPLARLAAAQLALRDRREIGNNQAGAA